MTKTRASDPKGPAPIDSRVARHALNWARAECVRQLDALPALSENGKSWGRRRDLEHIRGSLDELLKHY